MSSRCTKGALAKCKLRFLDVSLKLVCTHLRGLFIHPEMEMLPCAIVHGGTSKGVFFIEDELSHDPAKRDAVIEAILRQPRGGAGVLTGKLVTISPSTREDADVD